MANSHCSDLDFFYKLFPMLSPMQCQCVYYYSRGYSAPQIAEHVGINHQNVNKHLHAAAGKMGVSSLHSLRMRVVLDIDMLILSKLM